MSSMEDKYYRPSVHIIKEYIIWLEFPPLFMRDIRGPTE
jgi:hypothetical protein